MAIKTFEKKKSDTVGHHTGWHQP